MRVLRRTSSVSPTFTLSDNGKQALLIQQIQQLTASIYLERVKARLVNKKSLTSGDKNFAVLHKQLQGRINAMEDEQQHLIDEWETLTGKKAA